ncbi:hypothetical protein Tco_0903256 [Tanacetum coccineum]
MEWHSWLDSSSLSSKARLFLDGVGGTLMWFIWSFRNRLVFSSSSFKKSLLWDSIVSHSFLWISSRNPKLKLSWVDWLENPIVGVGTDKEKNHKKTVKTGQTRTREWKSTKEAQARNSDLRVLQIGIRAKVIENQVKVIMSSATSAVTYTSVYTDSEPGRAFWGADDEEVSEGGIPRVIVLGYDGLPLQPVAPPSPDYIPGPEDPQTPPVPQDEDEREPMFVQAHDPDYVPEPIYPEYIPLEDEHEFQLRKEYKDDKTEDGPVDYPMDGGDDRDDDDGDSSEDDADGEDEDDEEEDEEHLALADSAIASISLPPEAEVERLLAMTTPSPSPPISLSPPSTRERLVRSIAPPAHASPPPVTSPLLPSSGCPTQIQTLRIVGVSKRNRKN